jgi:hypothetical protein
MVEYFSTTQYIESASSLQEKIAKIDALINVMFTTATTAATGDNIGEYYLDDGQTIVRTTYRGVDAVTRSIKELQKLRDFLQATLNRNVNGSVIRLVDSSNLKNRNFNGR